MSDCTTVEVSTCGDGAEVQCRYKDKDGEEVFSLGMLKSHHLRGLANMFNMAADIADGEDLQRSYGLVADLKYEIEGTPSD